MHVLFLGPLLLFGLIFLGGLIGLVILLTTPSARAVAGALISILGLLAVLALLGGLVSSRVNMEMVEEPELSSWSEPRKEVRPSAAPAKEGATTTKPEFAVAPGAPPPWLEGETVWTRDNAYWVRVQVGPYPPDETMADHVLPCKVEPEELGQALQRDTLLHEMFHDAVAGAVAQYTAHLGPEHPGNVDLPTAYVVERLTADAWQSAAPGPDAIPLEPASEYASLVNLHLLLKFDSEARRFIAQRWKELVIQDRMTRVGCGLLGLVGLLGVVFGYLKVDLATGGTYRGWLRCAAGLAILAIVAASLLGVAA